MKVKTEELNPRPLQRRWKRRVVAGAVESEVWMITMLGDLDQRLQGRVMRSIMNSQDPLLAEGAVKPSAD